MTTLFKDIADLKTTVKINSNLNFEVLLPFIEDARDIYLVRYIGVELTDLLESGNADIVLLEKAKRALGPFTMMLAAPEMGIRIGDSGITVQNNKNGDYSPANDTKIAAAVDNFRFRGYQAIERLLTYLEATKAEYPEWVNSECYTLRQCNYLNSACDFQDKGLINIGYSRLTFEEMRCTLSMIEMRIIKERIGNTVDTNLRKIMESGTGTPAELILIDYIQKYVAAKVAEIYTSAASRAQREQPGTTEYRPVIRPLYEDICDAGNYFAKQAEFYFGKIDKHLNDFACELGVKVQNAALAWNKRENNLFCDIG